MLNEFEVAVLDRMAQSNLWLQPVTGNLRASSRKFTGNGSYTDFETDSAAVDVPDCHVVLDALISMPGTPNGMGAAVIVKAGYLTCLETFVYGGDHWDGDFNGFSLSSNA